MLRLMAFGVAGALFLASLATAEEAVRSLDDRIKIELFAEQPAIVTPTGLDVDAAGRVWAIESNTHFPPDGYTGHPTDRLLVFQDADGDGRAEAPTVFADGFTHAMSVAVWPVWRLDEQGKQIAPGERVIVATRKEIVLLFDDNRDLKCDRRRMLVRLNTPGNYPHNGLAGLAFDPLGRLIFGLGENLGEEYQVQANGAALEGGGEGGNIYRVNLDGGGLAQLATGFWNPHASCFDALGRLFSVDNDPDSRPPCRLLHIIPGGDYGYRFRNGRKGLHPFTSWNGEIAGTLPMTAGTGEAPSGVLAYSSDGLPGDYVGCLMATSWGDHRIDRFRLKPQGASFVSVSEPFIVGGDDFRPVGLACAPDGSLFATDWVLADYKLHGRGRIWRISSSAARSGPVVEAAAIAARPREELLRLLDSPRLEVRRGAARALAESKEGQTLLRQELEIGRRSDVARAEIGWALIGKDTAAVAATLSRRDAGAAAMARFLDRDAIRHSAGEKSTPGKANSTGPAGAPIDSEYLLASLAIESMVFPLEELDDAALSDPFVFSTVIARLKDADLAGTKNSDRLLNPRFSPLLRRAYALARLQDPEVLVQAVKTPDAVVRRAAIQYIAENRLRDRRRLVEETLQSDDLTTDLFVASLAALAMLDGANAADIDKTPAGKYVLPIVQDTRRPARVRALALRLVSPDDPELDEPLLREMLSADDDILRQETIHALASSSLPYAAALLRESVGGANEEQLTADAVAGLAAAARGEPVGGPTRKRLMALLGDPSPVIAREAVRALRQVAAGDGAVRQALKQALEQTRSAAAADWEEQIEISLGMEEPSRRSGALARPRTAEEWTKAAVSESAPGDAAAGRRAFFHTAGAGCFKCHTVGGRGGPVGPDLSFIGRSASRQRLIDSILTPSQEIAPQFVSWVFEMEDGKVHQGLIVHENEGRTVIGDSEGRTIEIPTAQLGRRSPQTVSLMPQGLVDKLTVQEFRDIVAFLEGLR